MPQFAVSVVPGTTYIPLVTITAHVAVYLAIAISRTTPSAHPRPRRHPEDVGPAIGLRIRAWITRVTRGERSRFGDTTKVTARRATAIIERHAALYANLHPTASIPRWNTVFLYDHLGSHLLTTGSMAWIPNLSRAKANCMRSLHECLTMRSVLSWRNSCKSVRQSV